MASSARLSEVDFVCNELTGEGRVYSYLHKSMQEMTKRITVARAGKRGNGNRVRNVRNPNNWCGKRMLATSFLPACYISQERHLQCIPRCAELQYMANARCLIGKLCRHPDDCTTRLGGRWIMQSQTRHGALVWKYANLLGHPMSLHNGKISNLAAWDEVVSRLKRLCVIDPSSQHGQGFGS